GTTLVFDPRGKMVDPDGDVLTITAVSTPSHGTASIVNSGKAISYTRNDTNSDSFTYTVSDGNGHTATATINVGTGTNPSGLKAVNDYVTVTGTNSLTFDPRLNDVDVADGTITITGISSGAFHGTVTFNGTSVTYTRTSAGTDWFTYTVSAGSGTKTATVIVL